MVKRLINTIIKYKIIPFLIFAFVLYYIYPQVFKLIINSYSLKNPSLLFEYRKIIIIFTYYALIFLFILIWITLFFLSLLSIRYHDLTGRKFRKDHGYYQLSYKDLAHYFKDANPYKMDEEKLPNQNWKNAEGVILGHKGKKLIKKDSEGEGNLALFGLPGSHKTTSQIIPTALQFNGSVLCLDIKGDVLRRTKEKRNIKIFNPEDSKNSCHFNVLEGIETLSISERCIFIENISYIIIQDEQGKDDNFFTSGARDFFCGIALSLLHNNINITFPEIINTIILGNAIGFCKSIAAGNCNEAKTYTNSMIGSNEKNVAGCFNACVKAIRPFISGNLGELLDGKGDCICPDLLENGYDVYIYIPQEKIKTYSPIVTVIVQNFMTAFMKREDNSSGRKLRPIIMLLDEFPQLQFDFDTLSMALSTLRSKGVSLFLAMQSIAQLEGRYGEVHSREIIDTCPYISVMSAQDTKSREFFQKLIGREKILTKTNSNSTSTGDKATTGVSIQQSYEYIYEAADFGNLKDDVIIVANGKYIQAQKTNCWE